MTNRAPLVVAITLLLLPVLYVASYFALVTPGSAYIDQSDGNFTPVCYRRGGRLALGFFWPLEQIDRGVRPAAWAEDTWNHFRSGRAPVLP